MKHIEIVINTPSLGRIDFDTICHALDEAKQNLWVADVESIHNGNTVTKTFWGEYVNGTVTFKLKD